MVSQADVEAWPNTNNPFRKHLLAANSFRGGGSTASGKQGSDRTRFSTSSGSGGSDGKENHRETERRRECLLSSSMKEIGETDPSSLPSYMAPAMTFYTKRRTLSRDMPKHGHTRGFPARSWRPRRGESCEPSIISTSSETHIPINKHSAPRRENTFPRREDMVSSEELYMPMKTPDHVRDCNPKSYREIINARGSAPSRRHQKSGLNRFMCCVAPSPTAYD